MPPSTADIVPLSDLATGTHARLHEVHLDREAHDALRGLVQFSKREPPPDRERGNANAFAQRPHEQVLRLIHDMQREHKTTLLFVTHDLGVVAQISDRMTVLYGGKALEQGATKSVLRRPSHAYTRALLAANPRYDRPKQSLKPVPEKLIARLRREIAR